MSAYYGSINSSDGVVETPDWFMNKLKGFNQMMFAHRNLYDPCPVNPKFDGLKAPFHTKSINYVNPPYNRGQIGQWVAKCYEEAESSPHKRIILLIPNYSDTLYYHKYIADNPAAQVVPMLGRMKFKGHKNALPTPLILVFFNFRGFLTRRDIDELKQAKPSK